MWPMRNIQRHYLKTILLFQNRNLLLRDVTPLQASDVTKLRTDWESNFSSFFSLGSVDGFRYMSTSKGRSMRSKVESRMKRETGKTLREIRRAKKLRKKLMTDQERLIYNLRRAKKKVALLLQKLKKYELPDLPPSRHDPELLTPEQLQAYKKIGFRNKNYVPVGVRGVFGGVVQNMHLHWKFHETVQVCCDNFPKEKIKEMATMLARLSGGIVVNVHDVKTIIMFRGRNYRQPKNLIPINTLTKRKALFKARFEQALDSQKLNIKKLEQQLRRMGVNPEDPVAIASIQRVASTFFRAIDEKQGSPYVFQEDKLPVMDPGLLKGGDSLEDIDAASEDSDQEELDRFIAGIEDAADQEWAEEEAKEQEDMGQIRYWNREEMGGRGRRILRSDDSEDETRGQRRDGGDVRSVRRISEIRRWDSDDEIGRASGADESDSDSLSGVPNLDSDEESLVHDQDERMLPSRSASRKQNMAKGGFKRSGVNSFRGKGVEETPSDDEFGDSEDGSWGSDGAEKPFVSGSKQRGYDYYSSSEDE